MSALGTAGYPPWPWSHLVISISHTPQPLLLFLILLALFGAWRSHATWLTWIYIAGQKKREDAGIGDAGKCLSILLLLSTRQELFIYLLLLLPWTWTSTHLSSGALWPTSIHKIRGSTNQDIMLIKVWCQFRTVQVFLTKSSTTSVTKCIFLCTLRKCKCPIKLISLIQKYISLGWEYNSHLEILPIVYETLISTPTEKNK